MDEVKSIIFRFIYYTVDGSEPNVDSSASAESGVAFTIGETAVVGEITVKAIAVKAEYVNSAIVEQTFTKERLLTTVLVENASFMAGADTSLMPAASGTSVTLTKSYYMGETEVTQGQYYDVMAGLTGENGVGGSRRPSTFGKDDSTGAWRNLPVETVNWYDAVEFCNALSIAEGLAPYYTIDKDKKDTQNNDTLDAVKWTVKAGTGLGYRLPTEAEWEYAARGGQNTASHSLVYAGTNDSGQLGDYAWYDGNAMSTTHEVKTKLENALGLHDMSGNVLELCWDWRGRTYPTSDENPTGFGSGSTRILRGGSFANNDVTSTVARRGGTRSVIHNNFAGFRVARSVAP